VAPGLGEKRGSIKVCIFTFFKFRIADELQVFSKVLSPPSTQLRKKTRVETMVTPVALNFQIPQHYAVFIILFH
jgi:hypothetical protein